MGDSVEARTDVLIIDIVSLSIAPSSPGVCSVPFFIAAGVPEVHVRVTNAHVSKSACASCRRHSSEEGIQLRHSDILVRKGVRSAELAVGRLLQQLQGLDDTILLRTIRR